MIRDWAARTPQAVALAAPGRVSLGFGRLATQIDYTVGVLNGLGIGRNDRVAIVLGNGPEMAAAFLGVTAGATAAPLSPAFRGREFDRCLSDLNAKLLIIQENQESPTRAIARSRGIPIVDLLPETNEAAGLFTLNGIQPAGDEAGTVAEPDDVALVLHTSGTTERPKIVPLTQANLCASASNIQGTLELVHSDCCLNVMPLFHIHGLVGVLLSSLRAGASVICTPGCQTPVFFDWVAESEPTWYSAVPAMHRPILDRVEQNCHIVARRPFRFIRSSSSPLPPQLMKQMEDAYETPVIESYGMTEAAHQMTSNPLPPGTRKPGSVGIAAGPEVAVIGETGQRLPANETGEIVIRGDSVTAGYEDNPEANTNAFVDGWFRSGDQGYLDADGYLCITGRLKEIINRGGEKIAPREIDEIFLDHPAVSQAVAFAVPDERLGEELALAIVVKPGRETDGAELRRFAANRVADHKVPRQILLLEELPKGPTDKVQRVGLAEKLGLTGSEATDSEAKTKYVAPRNALEENLAEIWSEVLRLERVGINDDFFRLGGDSLLATQIISRVREALHADLSFLVFFEKRTIAGIAPQVGTPHSGGKTPQPPPIAWVPRDHELPLSFAQERMWFLDQLQPGNPAYNRPVIFRLTGHLDVEALTWSLNEIVRRHEVLRTTFPTVEGRPVAHIVPARTMSLPVVDLRDQPEAVREAEGQRWAAQETQHSFDLTQGPLVRATLLRLRSNDHLLHLTFHHIVFDAWSEGIVQDEIAVCYDLYLRGIPDPLADLPVQYVDFARWQREWMRGEVLANQLSYWKQQLAGAPHALTLPTDHPRPQFQTFRGATESLSLPKSIVEPFQELTRAQGVTLYMSLLTAFQTLLYYYANQEDIIIASPVANRDRVQVEGLIGFFVNNLILRCDLSGNLRTAEQK